ncbi:SDR family oxidoreductase [Aliikangiella marina]|uniref:sulfoacetaldehyde reductase (NADPH) n=1 Tax=Aliikangiella marina TaxID=1712262 RepID=A0A545T954_9GAMM|nr:SDR family oxidoreductase [Aliikangiella marina]TQV73739.1 SDR family oxidoreductase [Aliikangiella marina]
MTQSSRKLAVITGASSGFGRATAIKLAQNGWQIVALARRVDRIESLQKELGEANCQIKGFDVRQDADIRALVDSLKSQDLSVDLLVNNAGLALGLDSADKADLNDWQTMIDTNITGLVKMTRALLPDMVAAKKGHIVNIGSIAGTYPYPGGNAYGATKAFVAQFSLNLRADLAGTGIRVTNIEPGLAESEFSLVRFHGDKNKADSIYAGVEPLTPTDIAESVFWCANQPAHVNINRIELMPTCQSFAPLTISKEDA